jgi:bifunctional DNase/RNase
MKRERLVFDSIQQIAGETGFSVITLTDEPRQRALAFVCDQTMTRQFALRMNKSLNHGAYLPEALVAMLDSRCEMTIYGVNDGQYMVVLMNMSTMKATKIRMSDACLLTMISDIPLYIDSDLMEQQCTPFSEDAKGVSIPINTIDRRRLRDMLQKAVDEENYELASIVRDELKRRQ